MTTIFNQNDLKSKRMTIRQSGEFLGTHKNLGDASGLNNIRVYHETLPPGHRSSSPHRHTMKEEMIYVLKGYPTVLLGGEEKELAPGDYIGFLPRDKTTHVLVNRTNKIVESLIISDDPQQDVTIYESAIKESTSLKLEMTTAGIDWDELAELYRRAPLGVRDPSDLEKAFNASFRVAIAWKDSELVGAGRIISDGVYYANIYDIAVKPEYQHQGIGASIMKSLLKEVPNLFKLLTTTVGREPFYEKFGFRKHKTAMAIYPPGKEQNAKLYLESEGVD